MDNSENRKILKGRSRSKNIDTAYPKKSTAQWRLHVNESIHVSHVKLLNDQLNGSETASSRIKTNNSTVPIFSADNKGTNGAGRNNILMSNVNASTKFSANDRLKKYRMSLNERKNEIVPVHQALNRSINKSENKSRSIYSNKQENNLLRKRPLPNETDKSEQSVDHEFKRQKIYKEIATVNAIDSHSNSFKKTENVKKTINSGSINPGTSSDITEMDWSPINETEIISNIQKFRESLGDKLTLLPDACSFISTIDTTCERSKIDTLYIVVDTNIFISHLHLIQNILLEEHVEHDNIVYVPWMVIQELDYFKDGRSGSSVMQNTATRAIKFINEYLRKKHKRFKGQTVREALSQKESISNADDNILFCCINLAQASKNVILLSNDINLRNKALINNVAAHGPKDILEKIKKMKNYEQNKLKINKIDAVLINTCTEIILAEMEDAYGSVLFNLIAKPPWDFRQCLIYIKRFWVPVFSIAISQKQCLKVIEDLLVFIQTHNDLATEENMEDFIKLCLSLCVYFKNCLTKYHQLIKTCIDNIQQILS